MKKIVLIPDSFKGTMSSPDICEIMKKEIHRHFPQAEVVAIPVADGGEGSVDSFLAAQGGTKPEARVKGPFFEDMDAFYGLLPDLKTAVIEMAACAGLPLVEGRQDPLASTTYGVGQLMMEAIRRGAKKIILGLGGSATNDGGCGAAAATGIRFLDRKGDVFTPTGGTLNRIHSIDLTVRDPMFNQVEIVAMCDIDNPMYGENGAAHVFGPQKGASPQDVEVLDDGLRHLAEVIRRDVGVSVDALPGAGAAGAMGAGMVAFFGARLQMGIEAVLDTVRFEQLVKGANLILTGEGRIDAQSLGGKVVVGVGRRAKKLGISVIAIVGDIADDIEPVYEEGITAVFSINRVAVPFSEVKHRAGSDLRLTIDSLMRVFENIKG